MSLVTAEASRVLSRTRATVPFPSNALDRFSISSKDLQRISTGLQDAKYAVRTPLTPLVSPLPRGRLSRRVSSDCPLIWSPKGLSLLVCLSRPVFAVKKSSER